MFTDEQIETKALELHRIGCLPGCDLSLNKRWREYAKVTLEKEQAESEGEAIEPRS